MGRKLKMAIKKTPLYGKHTENGGRMVDFAGYLLPISYSSIKEEHNNVREKVGLFDVSHMAEFLISGSSATDFLQKMTVNNVRKLSIGEVQYSLMCYEDGGIVDDLLIYKNVNNYMMVVNAANHQKDLEWLKKNSNGYNLDIKDISNKTGLLALQGPKSRALLEQILGMEINSMGFYQFRNYLIDGIKVMISRTGYTGELGYEIYSNSRDISNLWDQIMSVGKKFDIQPAGLGCRDTLRLEMKYMLYGSDISRDTNPFEAGLGWVTKLEKQSFIGKNALLKSQNKLKKKIVCIQMLERAIPRNKNKIYFEEKIIGEITSGTMSPSLGQGISIGYVTSKNVRIGSNVFIDIRGKKKKGFIVKPPFYKNGSLLN